MGGIMGRTDSAPTTLNGLANYPDGVSKQATSKTIQHMEDQDIIRLAPFPGDGRNNVVVYTDRGRTYRRNVLEIIDGIQCSRAALTGDAGVSALREQLTTVLLANQDGGLRSIAQAT